jgi:hypothetical protein
MIKGRDEKNFNFGSDAKREPLHHRNVAKSPFKDPTHLKAPSPATYKTKEGFANKDDLMLLRSPSGKLLAPTAYQQH